MIYKLAFTGIKPREKLFESGEKNLTDKELVSILLGAGIQGRQIGLLAQDVLDALDAANYQVDVKHFLAIPGIGKAKAALLAAAFELSRRTVCYWKTRIKTPSDVIRLVNHYADRKQEYFICITLNGAYEVINKRIISIGLINRTIVHPREVFSDAIVDRAAAIICAHNHPTGNLQPSQPDCRITRKLSEAGRVIGIQLLDHVIFCTTGYFSFQERGMM